LNLRRDLETTFGFNIRTIAEQTSPFVKGGTRGILLSGSTAKKTRLIYSRVLLF
jgi:hypothetical protein